ncbi:MAG: ATP-binding protein [Proteobacteria bacterium]|nr:ATP-binding protein [Pseudomonadota bacterium]
MSAKQEAAKDLFQPILNSIPIGIYIIDRELKIYWANERLLRWIKGKEISYTENKNCYAVIFGNKAPCEDCPAIKAFESGASEYAEMRRTFKGKAAYYLTTSTPLNEEAVGGGPLVIVTVQDVTAHKIAEEDLRRLNDFNTAIIDNAPVAIFTIDRIGKFISVNPALATLSGLGSEAEEKLVGFNWLQNPYTVRCGLAEHIKKGLQGEPFELQDFPFVTYRGDKGQYIHFRGIPLKGKSGKVEVLLCIIEDSSEKVKAKMQSIQDAKMSVIGRLMTGVAHELNNPLATIAANSELACELFQGFKEGIVNENDVTELRKYLDVIQEQAFRCKNIIKDMIDLTKKKGLEVQKIDLNACLNDLTKLINFKKLNIHFVKEIDLDLPHIKGDVNATKQSLMNILQNAVDAVEEREVKVIQLKAFPSGDTVIVAIEDNGVGIHEDLVDKIFEPFFSTKDSGKGVGLGLTLCYEFLNKMGGKIEVASTLGRGSTFKVIFPVYRKEDNGN